MAYEFDFDDKSIGTVEYPPRTYRLIQDGLEALLSRVREWNQTAVEHGAQSPPYADEESVLERMVSVGAEKLEDSQSRIQITGMSVGSERFLRAGLELVLRLRRSDLAERRAAGWPPGVLASIETSVRELERIASTMKSPPADILWEVLPARDAAAIAEQMQGEPNKVEWDVFVSHASDDKEQFVDPLATALRGEGLRVWYDSFALRVGDSLRRAIDKGLSRSRFGVVVLSPAFFAKEWPQKELDGLVAREVKGQKVILPVWHEIDAEGVRRYSPTLADRVAVASSKGIPRVVADLLEAMASPSSS
jgi:hypothetical protein